MSRTLLLVFLVAVAAVMVSGQTGSPSASPSSSSSPSTSPSASGTPSATPSASGTPSASPSNNPSPSSSPSPSPSSQPSTRPVPNVRASFETDEAKVTLTASEVSGVVSQSFKSIALFEGSELTVNSTTSSVTTTGALTTAVYETKFVDSSATLTQTYTFSTNSRSVEFAGRAPLTVPARAVKSVIELNEWPFPPAPFARQSGSLVIEQTVDVGAAINSVDEVVGDDITTLIVLAGTKKMAVRITYFTVALLDGTVEDITVHYTFNAGENTLTLTLTFPAFTNTLSYDPTIQVATTERLHSSASALSGIFHDALRLLF